MLVMLCLLSRRLIFLPCCVLAALRLLPTSCIRGTHWVTVSTHAVRQAKNLDQLLGFSTPMDHTKYDRYGASRWHRFAAKAINAVDTSCCMWHHQAVRAILRNTLRLRHAGYEREKSGIAVGADLTTEHWKPAKTRYDGTKY